MEPLDWILSGTLDMDPPVPNVPGFTFSQAGTSKQAAARPDCGPPDDPAQPRVPAATGCLAAFATTAGHFESEPRNEL